jgi:phosphopantetheinyl transferase
MCTNRPVRIAERHFTTAEREALQVCPEQDRQGLFFDVWTRKESYIKMLGTGLSTHLETFCVLDGFEPDGVFFHKVEAPGASCHVCSRLATPPRVVRWDGWAIRQNFQ